MKLRHGSKKLFVAVAVKNRLYALFQTRGDLLYLFGGLFGSKDNGDDGAGLLRLCGLCVCLLRFGCVHIGFVLFAALRLRVTHNAVFFRHFAPLKLPFPLVAAFHDIAVLGKRAFFLRGSVPAKSRKVNAAFPFFGHLYHAGLI